jgi:uncharacterized delta-60 repeat protein
VEGLEDRTTPSGGLLDPTFDGTGIETLPHATCRNAEAVAVQPDGKIVSVGRYLNDLGTTAVVRMNSDGTLDPTFNGTGSVLLSVGYWRPEVGGGPGNYAVALQPDGKILVGTAEMWSKGHASGREAVVVRLNPDGSLDQTFGNQGGMWVSNRAAGNEGVCKLAVLTDAANHVTGIMAGGIAPAAGFQSFAATRLTPAGLPDTTFGSGGTAIANVGGTTDDVRGMAITPSGGVVMVGSEYIYGVVVALTAAGQLDPAFNGTGSRVDNLAGPGGSTGYMGVAVQPLAGGGYGIVVAGEYLPPNGANPEGLVARYTSAGQLDPTFGSGGSVVTTAAGHFHDVALAADGSIVVGGNALYTGSDGLIHGQMAVGHLTANGAMDTTFGTAGTGISMVPPISVTGSDDANALAIGPDGRIVLAGWTGAGSTQQAAFARFTAAVTPTGPASLALGQGQVPAGSPVTLTASSITTTNAGATVPQMAFYHANSRGTEQFLGSTPDNADGTGTLTSTVNLAPGSYTLLALAVDSARVDSDPFALALDVV